MKTLILPYPPTVNKLYATVRGRRILSASGKAFKKEVATMAYEQKAGKCEGNLSIRISVYRPRKSGDLDNLIKIIQDSLKGICFDDDAQIVEIHAYRYDDKFNPRALVTVTNI